MRSPQSLRRNGESAVSTPSSSPRPRLPPPIPLMSTPSPHPTFHSSASSPKLRRFDSITLVFRVVTFIFSFSSAVFMLTNSRPASSDYDSDALHWFDYDAFRFVFAAGAIVALYSLLEMIASICEITRRTTLFPEFLQVWFDFGHDQAFLLKPLFQFRVRLHAAVGGIGGDGDGEDAEADGHVYGRNIILLAIGHIRCPWIRRLPLPRLIFPPIRLPGRLFPSHRLSLSLLVSLDH
ncbi:hypothetical protein V2J09_008314 [Rumex salicifolius]